MLILDGGTGRELARLGAPFRVPEWSALALIEGPAYVRQVHDAYLAAGAEIITTNSYAVVPFHLGEARFAAQGGALADLAGRLAREAVTAFRHRSPGPGGAGAPAAPLPWVAGSLPPVCGSYRADLFDPGQALPVLRVLVAGLRPHVDLWLAETLSTVREAALVREALGADTRPLWLSFTLRDDQVIPGDPRLRSGETVAAAVQAALAARAGALLFNCSQPEVMGDALHAARAALAAADAGMPVGVYANAFPPQGPEAEANGALDPIRSDLDPAGYLQFARQWQQAGAGLVGGCCGIGPEHIAALRAARDALDADAR